MAIIFYNSIVNSGFISCNNSNIFCSKLSNKPKSFLHKYKSFEGYQIRNYCASNKSNSCGTIDDYIDSTMGRG